MRYFPAQQDQNMPSSALPNLMDKFSEALTIQGRHASTVANYRFYLQRFLSVTRARETHHVTATAIANFQSWLKARRLKASTINCHCAAMRSFLKWLETEQLANVSPQTVKLLPTPPRAVTTLAIPGLNRLLNFPQRLTGRAILQHRDRAILELLGSSGLRVGEISRLRREQLLPEQGEIAVAGRGSKLRLVPLGNQARYWINQYLKYRHDRAPQLFVRHDPAARRAQPVRPSTAPGSPPGLTPRSIQRLIKKYAQAAGLGRAVKPRTLRHTVAAQLLTAGHDLETVRQRLGHQSLNTTKVYARPTRFRSHRQVR